MTPDTTISTHPARRNTGGAPRLNGNALRSGRYGLILGKLPPRCSYIRQQCAILRRELEQAVLAARGAISLSDALAIRTATRWERHALLCSRWLHTGDADLTPEQRLALSRDIANASERSDKAVRSLAFKTQTVWEALHKRLPDVPSDTPASPATEADTQAVPADDAPVSSDGDRDQPATGDPADDAAAIDGDTAEKSPFLQTLTGHRLTH